MEWKKDLCSLVKLDILTEIEKFELFKLSVIRDKIFRNYFDGYGYLTEETNLKKQDKINIINIGLFSIGANRKIQLRYLFYDNHNPLNGSFIDTIYIFNESKGWDIKIDMDVLVKKRTGILLKEGYNTLRFYKGTFEEKLTSCLNTIKYNYDTYALDIISGENWDRETWRDYDWR